MRAVRDGCRSERLYRQLLRSYPRAFREQYGEAMVELFRDLSEAAGAGGSARLVRFWLRTFSSVVINGLLERGGDGARRLVEHVQFVVSLGRAGRTLLRSPGVNALVVLTLALGIGANVALFSVLRGVLLQPLPFPEAERLVRIRETNAAVGGEQHGPSPLNFADWDGAAADFESMAAWYLTSGTYRGDFGAEEIRSAQVTVDFFRVLGVRPAIGRDFVREEVVRYGPVMLSDRVWERLFGRDPAVIGRRIVSSNLSYEIVGVMPPDFAFPDASVETWIAWDLRNVYRDRPESRTWRFLDAIGRLAPGVPVAGAESSLRALTTALAEAHPAENRGWEVSLASLHEEMVGAVRSTLWMAFAAVLCLLLIACANVANLLLARVPARGRDLAIRSALGASRRRLSHELVAENVVLSGVAGLLGLAIGVAMLDALVAIDAGRIPRLSEVRVDGGVLVFTLVVTAFTGMIFGLVPTLHALDGAVVAALRGTRGSASAAQQRVREVFVVSQIAVALVLLTAASLLVTTLSHLTRQDPGIDPRNVATFRVSLDPVDGTSEEIVGYYDGLLTKLRELPGVERAGAAQTLPLNPVGNDFTRPFRHTGSSVASADAPLAQMRIITDGYIEAVGMRVIAGRTLPATVRADEPLVALVNETMARRLWPAGIAVGETFDLDFRDGWQPYRVLGVVADVKHYGPRQDARAEAYVAHAQVPYLAMSFAVRTTRAARAMHEAMRAAVVGHLPMQPPHNFVTLAALTRDSVSEERFLSLLLTVFSAIALLLCATGVYGVMSYSVSQRRREIGVRIALGADPRQVVARVLGRAAALAGTGIVLGIVIVVSGGGLIDSLLYGITPRDPVITLLVASMMLIVASLAAWLPARRAASIAPVVALGSD